MQISRPDEKTVALSQLDALIVELMRRITPSADPGDSEAARARLYSPPTHDEGESGFAEDWREFVEPELASLFKSSLEVIEGDVGMMTVEPMSGEARINVAVAHLESWIHGLNQARLALHARYDFTEEEMDGPLIVDGEPRSLARVQIRFYAMLQERFLYELDHD